MNTSEASGPQAQPSAAGEYLPLNFNDEPELPACRPGDCETCGQWDSELQEGMCEWCRQQYGVAGEA